MVCNVPITPTPVLNLIWVMYNTLDDTPMCVMSIAHPIEALL